MWNHSIEKRKETELNPAGNYFPSTTLLNDEVSIELGYDNKESDHSIKISDCELIGDTFFVKDAKNNKTRLELPGGITWGASYQDVVSAYGESTVSGETIELTDAFGNPTTRIIYTTHTSSAESYYDFFVYFNENNEVNGFAYYYRVK